MTEYSVDEARDLIGIDYIPRPGGIPAVWWITTDSNQLAAYDRWQADFDAHRDKVAVFAATVGLKDTDAMMWTGFGRSEFTGFRAPQSMLYYQGHPEHKHTPDGWRIDRKKGYLVPVRRTKKDRESQVNKDFNALSNVPNVRQYVSGLPTDIYLDNRDFGGTIYQVGYRRGEKCVWAYCGGDPDRSPDHRKNAYDTTIWHRQKLSVLVALTEEKEPADAQ